MFLEKEEQILYLLEFEKQKQQQIRKLTNDIVVVRPFL